MAQSPKVVIIHNVISPHVTPVFQELARRIDLTVIYCAEREDNRTWEEKPTGFNYEVLASAAVKLQGKDLFTYFINPDILATLRRLKPEVVIISGWDILSYQLACLYCSLMGIPYLIWSGSTKFEPSWRRSVSWPLVKLMLAGAKGYIAYGTRAKEYLESFGVAASKITIAFNSTRTDYFHLPSKSDISASNQLKKKLGLQNRHVILYYGQLIERKGVDVLLRAYALLKKEYSTTALLVIGTGQELASLKLLQQQLSVTEVVYLRNPKDDEMADYYYLSSVAVLPSREEVWGLVVNQALQCGVPMIVSDKVGSGPDLIVEGSTGFVFESDDETSLAQALQRYFEKSAAWPDMSKKAADHSKIALPSQTALKIHQAIRKVV